MYVWACVCERVCVSARARARVCVCVCVCVWKEIVCDIGIILCEEDLKGGGN